MEETGRKKQNKNKLLIASPDLILVQDPQNAVVQFMSK